MVLLIFLVTLVFIFSAFSAMPLLPQASPFSEYVFYEKVFLFGHLILFCIGFVVLTVLFFRFNFDKKYKIVKIFFFSALQTCFVFISGFFLAFLCLFLIAGAQLNFSATIINLNPKMVGIEDNETLIFKKLQTLSGPPIIIASDKDQKEILRAIAASTTGRNTFYGSAILPAIPNGFIFSIEKLHDSLLLIDNTLIISKINPQDMQLLSPLIGYDFVKNYFPTRVIKSYPKIAIMTKTEYLAYRKDDAKKKIIKIDAQIKKLDSIVSSISASMKKDEKNDTEENQNLLADYSYYDVFFKKQKNVLLLQLEKIPHENGVFVSPDSIKLTLDTTNPHGIADYFATVTHEYLHYASYVSDEKRFDSSFFEEGLTEYFARRAIKDTLNISTNLGYPVQVKIIGAMTNLITETELADIYFDKDEDALEQALDRVYGDGFYQNNEVLFETLQYASDSQQTLEIANKIMQKIGGPAVTQQDLYSSYSKL